MSKVKDYMKTDFTCIADTTPLYQVFKRMNEDHLGFLVVIDASQQIKGVLSRTDIVRAHGTSSLREGGAIVRDLITSRFLIAIGSEDFMEDAVVRLNQFNIHQLAVVDILKPVGILTQEDVIRWMWEEQNHRQKQDDD